MWWVQPEGAQARATGSLEEALALSAHLTIRGHRVTCIVRSGKSVMDSADIRHALDNLDNASPSVQRLQDPAPVPNVKQP